ncbi:uncharacterized protein STEHIDRAFT_62664, partial [Stereum hirsutum FP-91666 SS1]|uniref:uncharacterized protein n=1 Tax=Stereum hirsutum (strain FP-91666) TaxID=721885 RepID=UPI0004449461
GCSLATKEWVDNHWGLILWKLAGMVCLDPGRERDMDARRWSWDEVMRQLRYRYEKELNGGSRPALRLITTQDSPASSPMVLCISNIFWSESGVTSDGLAIAACPELEMTDGWYKLRATVDPPLARAIERGAIRVGRKIAVAGAKLSTGKSEPCEVLDAYETVQLSLSGNSAHIAPWHAKLGFTNGLCVSTLHSLTPDGGPVQMLDLIVTKAYPIAFLEFIEDENGNKTREGPRKEKEEMEIHEQWRVRFAHLHISFQPSFFCHSQDGEEARLRQDFETKMSVYQGWADKLALKARRFFPSDDDIFDDLDGGGDYHQATAHLTNNQAGWLARYIHERSIKERESINEEIERDLKVICPPRDVRNFRVLFMKDAHTDRRPSHRTAEITVWDVLSLSFDEGRQPGTFKEGQRFLVSNLLPSQHGAWMPTTGDDPHIYLSTRRDSRWRRL